MPFHPPIPGKPRGEEARAGMRMFVEAENLMQIAFILPSAVFIGWLLGAWVGSKLHCSWLQLVGLFIGCAAGLVSVVRMALEAERKAARADRELKREEKHEEKGSQTDIFKP